MLFVLICFASIDAVDFHTHLCAQEALGMQSCLHFTKSMPLTCLSVRLLPKIAKPTNNFLPSSVWFLFRWFHLFIEHNFKDDSTRNKCFVPGIISQRLSTTVKSLHLQPGYTVQLRQSSQITDFLYYQIRNTLHCRCKDVCMFVILHLHPISQKNEHTMLQPPLVACPSRTASWSSHLVII